MYRPLCFVLMPFGKKSCATGKVINFDSIYSNLLIPSIEEAGFEPIRADQEVTGGIIHKPMFERLILCEYAIADLTTANANVFYELGIRHAVRQWSTILIFAEGETQLPFDVAPLRAIPYYLDGAGIPLNIDKMQKQLVKRLIEAKVPHVDSPIYQLVEGFPEIDHTKTDIFRDRVKYSKKIKDRLFVARKQGVQSIRDIQKELGNLRDQESGVVIDLFLSYRAVKAWEDMILVTENMSQPLSATTLVQEQLAFALNRSNKSEEAEQILINLINNRGPSSETYGILGRVYKDRWEKAINNNEDLLAQGILDKAIDAYLKGFEADWRDAYPGINAITLMEIRIPPDPQRNKLLPIVTYAVERRIASGNSDYWDYATLLELSVLGKNEDKALKMLCNALALIREKWEPETTANNLRLIRKAREKRQEILPWAIKIEKELQNKAN